MIVCRQSTARTVMVGPVLDADGVAVTDGVVADLKISKNGAAPAALNGSATLTHRNTGHYSLALTASDLDTVGQAEVVIDDTVNAMPTKELTVVEEAVYDALFAASAPGYGVAQTGDSFARIGANGAGLTALGDTRIANLDATVSSRLAAAGYTAPDNASISAILEDTGTTLPTTLGTLATSASIAALNNLSVTDVENAVWDATMADHLDAGTTGATLNGAGSAGDPWGTSLPGAYGAGTAGFILGTNLDATISSRSSHSAADVWAVATRVLTAGTNIQLPSNGLANITAWTVAITGNITGNLSGSVGSVTGAVGSIAGVTFPTNFAALLINASGHISRVTLVDTTTTNTDMLTADTVWAFDVSMMGGSSGQAGIMLQGIDTKATAINAKTSSLTFTTANKVDAKLTSDGADLVLVDGKTLPAALQIIGAVVGGKISGAGTGVEVFLGLDGATTRVTVTVDNDGNRTAVVYA